MESIAHREAKRYMLLWLREEADKSEFANFAGISWRVNRGPPFHGVWSEYPILPNGRGGNDIVWDEWEEDGSIPTYAELMRRGTPPTVVLDIAIQHKGRISYAIEIKHTHACSERKIDFLRSQSITLLEIPTQWILGQVFTPRRIPEEFLLFGTPLRPAYIPKDHPPLRLNLSTPTTTTTTTFSPRFDLLRNNPSPARS